ncbi:hypothetical protein [Desulfococcus sp.]|uniref:hypothetical protein n=1 Tax=Desulfococcus sp. TaxID=2025834 RepID=UPI003594755A
MPTDYRDAADRHFDDANHLLTVKRPANADHIFGLAAECALKAVMLGLGMQMHTKKRDKPEDPYAVHINQLWGQFHTFAQGRNGAKYAAVIDPISNPFHDWDVNRRYCHRSDITNIMLQNHKNGAEKTKLVLSQAILDGVVS